jgi:hypothetical protein
MTGILYRLWKKKVWLGWQVCFNHFSFWEDYHFRHSENYIGSAGADFLSWWHAFAKTNFSGAYELDRGVVRFMRWRDKKRLTRALSRSVYCVVANNNQPIRKTQIQQYLQDRNIEYFMVVRQTARLITIYGLDFEKLDLIEFKIKFGTIHCLNQHPMSVILLYFDK